MENQTTHSEQLVQSAKVFSAFGTPAKIVMDGEDITAEIIKDFGGVDKWLRRFAAAFNDFRILSFTISRINGIVKLYVRSVY